MGIVGANWYGEDLGSAIEDLEKIIANIKTNKFDYKDVIKLYKANGEVLKAIIENEYKD
jgi:hypothetical protein